MSPTQFYLASARAHWCWWWSCCCTWPGTRCAWSPSCSPLPGRRRRHRSPPSECSEWYWSSPPLDGCRHSWMPGSLCTRSSGTNSSRPGTRALFCVAPLLLSCYCCCCFLADFPWTIGQTTTRKTAPRHPPSLSLNCSSLPSCCLLSSLLTLLLFLLSFGWLPLN